MSVRRVKSYSGETGIVYQYVFAGQRRARRGWLAAGTEYVFDVSSDRKTNFPLPVFVRDDALRSWQKAHGRELSDAEQYAAAKMRLFRAFDHVENLSSEATVTTMSTDSISVQSFLRAFGRPDAAFTSA